MIRVVRFCYLKSHGPWVYFPNTNRPVDFRRPKPATPQSSRTAKLKRRLSHEIHATECRQVILPHDIYPETSRKTFQPLRVSSENMLPPQKKNHDLKISFSQETSARTRGARGASGVCKPSSLASFNTISKRWVFRDRVDMSSSWQMLPGWETAGAESWGCGCDALRSAIVYKVPSGRTNIAMENGHL